MSAIKKIDREGIVAYKTAYAKIPGSDPVCALFLSQVCYWCAKTDDGVAWVTHQAMFDQAGMTRKQQDRAADFWVSVGVIQKFVKGIPPKIHYFVDFDALEALILQSVLLVHMPERDILGVPKGHDVMSERDKSCNIDSIDSIRLCTLASLTGEVSSQQSENTAVNPSEAPMQMLASSQASSTQPQSEALAPQTAKKKRNVSAPKKHILPLEEFVAWAKDHHPTYDAAAWWKRMDSQDWIDGHGNEIKNSKAKFNTAVTNGWIKPKLATAKPFVRVM